MVRRGPVGCDPACAHGFSVRARLLFGTARENPWGAVYVVGPVGPRLRKALRRADVARARDRRLTARKLRQVRLVSIEITLRVYPVGEEASAPNASACSWA